MRFFRSTVVVCLATSSALALVVPVKQSTPLDGQQGKLPVSATTPPVTPGKVASRGVDCTTDPDNSSGVLGSIGLSSSGGTSSPSLPPIGTTHPSVITPPGTNPNTGPAPLGTTPQVGSGTANNNLDGNTINVVPLTGNSISAHGLNGGSGTGLSPSSLSGIHPLSGSESGGPLLSGTIVGAGTPLPASPIGPGPVVVPHSSTGSVPPANVPPAVIAPNPSTQGKILAATVHIPPNGVAPVLGSTVSSPTTDPQDCNGSCNGVNNIGTALSDGVLAGASSLTSGGRKGVAASISAVIDTSSTPGSDCDDNSAGLV